MTHSSKIYQISWQAPEYKFIGKILIRRTLKYNSYNITDLLLNRTANAFDFHKTLSNIINAYLKFMVSPVVTSLDCLKFSRIKTFCSATS